MTLISDRGVPGLDRAEAAEAAYRQAKRLLPIWTRVVRAVARNPKLKVELTGGAPRTDGKTVWLQVPVAFGATEHDRIVCGQFDSAAGRMKCTACHLEMQTDCNLFHECAHMLGESFGYDKLDYKIVELLAEWLGTSQGHVEARLTATQGIVLEMFRRLTGGDHIPFYAWNMIEDAAVNDHLFGAREGLRPMFMADELSILQDGVTMSSGKCFKHTEADPWTQALTIFYFDASGYEECINEFDATFVSQLRSAPEWGELLWQVWHAKRVNDRIVTSLNLLLHLRAIGIEPPKPENKPGEGEKGDDGAPQQKQEMKPSQSSTEESDGEPEQDSPEKDTAPGEAADDEEQDDEDNKSGQGGSSEDDEKSDSDDDGDAEGSGDEDDDTDDVESNKSTGADGDDDMEDEGDDFDDGESEEGDDGEADADGSPSGGVEPGEGEPEASDQGEHIEDEEYDDEVSDDSGFSAGGGAHSKGSSSEVDLADPDTMAEALGALTGHSDFGDFEAMQEDHATSEPLSEDEELIERLVNLDGWLDGAPLCINQLLMDRRGNRAPMVDDAPYDPPMEVMMPATQRMRLAFTANRASGLERNLESGRRLDSKTLGYRIPADDGRIFTRRSIPRKRDWTVLCGIDISGSTAGWNIEIEKSIAIAMGDLLRGFAIPFSMWAHTGKPDRDEWGGPFSTGSKYKLIITPVKREHETWNEGRKRAAGIGPGSFNLDGHTLMVYRKLLERQRGADKLLLYFTDGKMPAENYKVELPVLQREIEICKRSGIHLVGVGINTDSPKEHGLDTIRVNSIHDVPMFVKELGKRLTVK